MHLSIETGHNKKGDTFIVTAKNKTEQKKIERELKVNQGKLKGFDYTTASTGLSGIMSEDVPTDAAGHLILADCVPLKAPVKKPILKKAKSVVGHFTDSAAPSTTFAASTGTFETLKLKIGLERPP